MIHFTLINTLMIIHRMIILYQQKINEISIKLQVNTIVNREYP